MLTTIKEMRIENDPCIISLVNAEVLASVNTDEEIGDYITIFEEFIHWN